MQERLAGECEAAVLAGIVAVSESDVCAVVGHDAFGAEGGAIDIGCQVFQGGFTGADGLDVSHPVDLPCPARDLNEEFGMFLLEDAFEPGAEAGGQRGLRQEVV